MMQSGIQILLHYLDDFFFCGPQSTEVCNLAISKAVPLSHRLGLPVAPTKVEGPATTLCLLGIEIDSVNQELRLPQEKLLRFRSLLHEWSSKRVASKHQLQCLLGHLSHAARVVKPGRSFLRELISALSILKHSYHKVHLNMQCRADIMWWKAFCERWNGVSFFPDAPASIPVVSDASGSWGCSAFTKPTLAWFQLSWPAHWEKVNITIKELVPVVVSAAVWGHIPGQTKVFCSWCMSSIKDPVEIHMCHTSLGVYFSLQHILNFHIRPHISPGRPIQVQTHYQGIMLPFSFSFSTGQIPISFQHPASSSRPTVHPRDQLDISLEHLVSQYFSHSLAPATHATYASAKKRYMSRKGICCTAFNLPLLPITQHKVTLFSAYLARSGLRAASISSYLSALRHLTIEVGQVPPAPGEWPTLQYVIRGIKRSQSKEGSRPRRLPIMAEVMRVYLQLWPPMQMGKR